MFLVLAKYTSKYGLVVFAIRLPDGVSPDSYSPDMNNVYIRTLYFKGSQSIEVGSAYPFQIVKGENSLSYCFL